MSEKSIYDFLNQLQGEKISGIGRCSNMLWLGIGDIIETEDWKNRKVKKSRISLHVQSAWRIVNREKREISLATSDFYSPNSLMNEKEFEWDVQGNNLFDEKAQEWLNKNDNIYIKEYKINRYGDLQLIFSNEDCLEVFVTSSDDTECWRLFGFQSNMEHLVMKGTGYKFE